MINPKDLVIEKFTNSTWYMTIVLRHLPSGLAVRANGYSSVLLIDHLKQELEKLIEQRKVAP